MNGKAVEAVQHRAFMQGLRTIGGEEKRDPTSTHLTSLLSDFLMAGCGGV